MEDAAESTSWGDTDMPDAPATDLPTDPDPAAVGWQTVPARRRRAWGGDDASASSFADMVRQGGGGRKRGGNNNKRRNRFASDAQRQPSQKKERQQQRGPRVRPAVDPKPHVDVVEQAEYQRDWVETRCTEGHVECEGNDICVYQIRKTIPCRNEMKLPGSCPYGEDCFFSHVFENAKPFNIIDDHPGGNDRAPVVCQHELRQPGSCRYGDRCFYSHDLSKHMKEEVIVSDGEPAPLAETAS